MPTEPKLKEHQLIPTEPKLKEHQRKEIFRTLYVIKDLTTVMAEIKYPDNVSKYREAQWKYEQEMLENFMKEYPLTPEQVVAIKSEGIQKRWPARK